MSKPGAGHTHDQAGAVNPWRWLDIVVWVTVALIAALATEWLFGKLVRESIASGASKYLRARTPAPAPTDD